MRRFTFDNFELSDQNRKACEACRGIAQLASRYTPPLIITGGPGTGKTHLLYAVVNLARSGPARTGVALITSEDFPEEVQRLIVRPAPVEHTRNAILLIDDIDRFGLRARRVVELVDLFLRNGHYVVLSLSRPINEVNGLPDALLRMASHGSEISLGELDSSRDQGDIETPVWQGSVEFAKPSAPADESPDLRETVERLAAENALLKAASQDIGPLRDRIADLENRLTEQPAPTVQPASPSVLEKAAALIDEVEESRARIADIRNHDATAPEAGPVSAPEVAATVSVDRDADAEITVLRDERHRLREHIEDLAKETATLRSAVARANQERDETRRQLRAAFEKLKRYESNIAELKEKLLQGEDEQRLPEAVSTPVVGTNAMGEAQREHAEEIAIGLREVQVQIVGGLRTIDELAAKLDELSSGGTANAAKDMPTTHPVGNRDHIHPFPIPPGRDGETWEPSSGSVRHIEDVEGGEFFGFPDSESDAAI